MSNGYQRLNNKRKFIREMEAMEEMELYSGSRVPKRYLSGVESWICDSGIDMFREGYHLMTKMFVEYVYYCKLYDIEPICTDRLFSKSLQKLGYPMKRSRYGTMFCINPDGGGTDCEGADSAYEEEMLLNEYE